MGWFVLLLSAIADVFYGIGLYHSRGFTVLGPSLLAGSMAVTTTVLLSYSMKTIPAGTAFAAWSGIATIGIALYGLHQLGESRDLFRLSMIGLILAGVIGLKVTSPS